MKATLYALVLLVSPFGESRHHMLRLRCRKCHAKLLTGIRFDTPRAYTLRSMQLSEKAHLNTDIQLAIMQPRTAAIDGSRKREAVPSRSSPPSRHDLPRRRCVVQPSAIPRARRVLWYSEETWTIDQLKTWLMEARGWKPSGHSCHESDLH